MYKVKIFSGFLVKTNVTGYDLLIGNKFFFVPSIPNISYKKVIFLGKVCRIRSVCGWDELEVVCPLLFLKKDKIENNLHFHRISLSFYNTSFAEFEAFNISGKLNRSMNCLNIEKNGKLFSIELPFSLGNFSTLYGKVVIKKSKIFSDRYSVIPISVFVK